MTLYYSKPFYLNNFIQVLLVNFHYRGGFYKLQYIKTMEKFSLKWNDFHSNVSKSFGLFRSEEYLQDVTLMSEDYYQVSAHKLVLSACSEHFRNIFKNSKKSNTLICLDGVSKEDLKNILDFIFILENHTFFKTSLIDSLKLQKSLNWRG